MASEPRGVFQRRIAAGHAFPCVPPLFVIEGPEDWRGVEFHSVGLFSNSVAAKSFLVRLSADTPDNSGGAAGRRSIA